MRTLKTAPIRNYRNEIRKKHSQKCCYEIIPSTSSGPTLTDGISRGSPFIRVPDGFPFDAGGYNVGGIRREDCVSFVGTGTVLLEIHCAEPRRCCRARCAPSASARLLEQRDPHVRVCTRIFFGVSILRRKFFLLFALRGKSKGLPGRERSFPGAEDAERWRIDGRARAIISARRGHRERRVDDCSSEPFASARSPVCAMLGAALH